MAWSACALDTLGPQARDCGADRRTLPAADHHCTHAETDGDCSFITAPSEHVCSQLSACKQARKAHTAISTVWNLRDTAQTAYAAGTTHPKHEIDKHCLPLDKQQCHAGCCNAGQHVRWAQTWEGQSTFGTFEPESLSSSQPDACSGASNNHHFSLEACALALRPLSGHGQAHLTAPRTARNVDRAAILQPSRRD